MEFSRFLLPEKIDSKTKKIFLTKIDSRIFVKIEVKLLKFLSSIDYDDSNL